jgi:hypothetical protein
VKLTKEERKKQIKKGTLSAFISIQNKIATGKETVG